jgi:dTDP-4-amino-4,6-dideoxygalactose transaminase
VTEQLCDEILSLPMFPEMTAGQVQYVSTQVIEFLTSVPVTEWAGQAVS